MVEPVIVRDLVCPACRNRPCACFSLARPGDVLRDAIGAGRCSRPLIRRLLRVRGADLPSSVPAAVFEQPDADPVYFEALAAFIEGSAA